MKTVEPPAVHTRFFAKKSIRTTSLRLPARSTAIQPGDSTLRDRCEPFRLLAIKLHIRLMEEQYFTNVRVDSASYATLPNTRWSTCANWPLRYSSSRTVSSRRRFDQGNVVDDYFFMVSRVRKVMSGGASQIRAHGRVAHSRELRVTYQRAESTLDFPFTINPPNALRALSREHSTAVCRRILPY